MILPSPRELELIRILYDFWFRREPQPSLRELATMQSLKGTSYSAIGQRVARLALKGYLIQPPGVKSRNWRLTEQSLLLMRRERKSISRESLVEEFLRIGAASSFHTQAELARLAGLIPGME